MSLYVPKPGYRGGPENFPARFEPVVKRMESMADLEGYLLTGWEYNSLFLVCGQCYRDGDHATAEDPVIRLEFKHPTDGRAVGTLCLNADACEYRAAVSSDT